MQPAAPASRFSIDCRFEDNGWAWLTFRSGAESFEIIGGYCTDLFGDMARAAVKVADLANEAVFRLDNEPQEWRVLIHAPSIEDHSLLEIKILAFADIGREEPDEMGAAVFACFASRAEFGREVRKVLEDVHMQLGDDGYSRVWGGMTERLAFPHKDLAKLVGALTAAVKS